MSLLIREDNGPIARLTLNRPDALNALSVGLLEALRTEFKALDTDRSIRAIVLAGSGRAFCAGHDLKEMTAARSDPDGGAASFKALFDLCAEVMQMIPRLPQPLIAEVHGMATAAGCQLVASADLAIASEEARFGVNGVNIGLFCSTPMVALSRSIPRKQAFEMLTTGGFITAARAAELGLINKAVPGEALKSETETLARTIADKLASAQKIGKRAFYDQIQMPLDQAYAFTGEVIVKNMLNTDTEEGIRAFLDKRPPEWSQ
jgi:enoyl-CoA hydratase/carnithine racemase